MKEKATKIWDNVASFIKKYAWAISIFFALCAILCTLLPVIKYEIREAVYDIATGERVSKSDYVYGMSLVSYFTTGFKVNYTMYITIGIILFGIGLTIASIFKKNLRIAGGLTFLLAMCMFILSKEFFKADENAVMDYAPIVGQDYIPGVQTVSNSLHDVMISWGAALGIAFCTIAFSFTTIPDKRRTVREIAEEGVMISLAFVLSLVKIPIGVTGGSINFQMLPLMIIALRHGPAHGFAAGGIIYGLLTCLTDGYGFACYPFDYLIGFGSVAIIGLFRKYIFSENQQGYNIKGLIFIFIAGLLSTFVRYVGSNVSSIVVYGYTLQAALAYNAFYIPLSGLISTVALMALYAPLIQINNRYPVRSEIKKEADAPVD